MAAAPAFEWPSHFQFRPFFTLQPVQETREKQLKLWRELVLSYHEHHRLYVLASTASDELFRNPAIDRQLPSEGVDAVVASLLAAHEAEWDDPDTRTTLLIYWKTPEALAREVAAWAAAKLTRFDAVVAITDLLGEASHAARGGSSSAAAAPFQGVHTALMARALSLLEEEGKCAVMGDVGVKFAV